MKRLSIILFITLMLGFIDSTVVHGQGVIVAPPTPPQLEAHQRVEMEWLKALRNVKVAPVACYANLHHLSLFVGHREESVTWLRPVLEIRHPVQPTDLPIQEQHVVMPRIMNAPIETPVMALGTVSPTMPRQAARSVG